MTIKDFAEDRGITVQAIYSKLKAKSIPIERITAGKSKDITEEGQAVLNGLFTQSIKEIGLIETLKHELKQAQDALEAQRQANEVLQSKLMAAEDRANKAEQDSERWFTMAQALTERVPKLMPAVNDQQKKKKTIRQAIGDFIAGRA